MKFLFAAFWWVAFAGPSLALQEPFPTSKTVSIKEDDKVWFVNERATIANSVSVSSLRACRIEGRAKDKDNVILVSGSLELKAVTGGTVMLENIWIELAPDAKSLYLSLCEFKGGGVRVSDQSSTSAKVFIENSHFGVGANLALSMKEGSVDLQGSNVASTVSFKGLPLSEKSPNKTTVSILSCNNDGGGLSGGLEISGIANVQVRNSDLGGGTTRIADCPKLDFDGNNVHSLKLVFFQTVYGSFGATKIHNCDFRTSRIEFRTPAPEKKLEQVILDHCWFKGLTDPETITDTMIVDHASDATTGVTVTYGRISPMPLGLGGGIAR